MKNHDSHPTGSTTPPEEDTTSVDGNHNRGGYKSAPNDKARNFYLFSCYFACCNSYSD